MEFSPSGAPSVEGFECESPDAGDVDMKPLSPKGSPKPQRVGLRHDVHLAEGGTEISRLEAGGAGPQPSGGSTLESTVASVGSLPMDDGREDDEAKHESDGACEAGSARTGSQGSRGSEDPWTIVGARSGKGGHRSDMGNPVINPFTQPGESRAHLPIADTGSCAQASNRYLPLAIEEIVSDIEDVGEEELIRDERLTGSEVSAGHLQEEATDPVQCSFKRRPRLKPFGSTAAHARFLQHMFRRSRMVRPSCWSRGGWVHLRIWRPVTIFACRGGRELATDGEFLQQKARSDEVLGWYRQYVELLRRLESGRTPTAVVTFCGQGGVSEGIRRGGGAAHGQDIVDQPSYRRRFGEECFSRGDSRSTTQVRDMMAKARAFFLAASPPCKAYSSAQMKGEAKEGPMIGEARKCAQSTGKLYAIENVVNAKQALGANTTLLRGSFFGLHVDRPRLFETNFELHVDAQLREGAASVGRRSCMGSRRRWRRLDPFGRPEMTDCCDGNLWAVLGERPLRCTVEECADAMGVDRDHMEYPGLAQAIPPVYAQLVFSQACMREVESKFGLEAITFDEFMRNPSESRRKMIHWLRGAGGDSPQQGVLFHGRPERPVHASSADEATKERKTTSQVTRAFGGTMDEPKYAPVHGNASGDQVKAAGEASVLESERRELYWSWAGDFTHAWGSRDRTGWLSELTDVSIKGTWGRLLELGGKSSFISMGRAKTLEIITPVARLCHESKGTMVAVEARCKEVERKLAEAGFEKVQRTLHGKHAYRTSEKDARCEFPFSFWSIGELVCSTGDPLDYSKLEEEMDPLDRTGAVVEPKSAKAARSYMPIPWEPTRWDIGLPDELNEAMAKNGVGIEPAVEPGGSEVPFYPFVSQEGLMKSIVEADRALLAGAMEYVPARHIEDVEKVSTIHPWTIVDQGGGKWRLCHDYSVGTNRVVPTAPFSLPTVWDVSPVVRTSSHFAKYDIRDGFWHVPIAESSRKRLVVRHPGTGRLMWATRLPFGYLESPRIFCGLTEAIVQRLREQAKGKGIHFYVFVDDILVVGDDAELTKEGCALLEEEFKARGLQWAPNKTRGPCKCIEFLGLLISNAEGQRGVTVTEKRLKKLMAEIESWQSRKPEGGKGELEVDPRELAQLLGRLVFASQVVRGGRTYMQGMLAAFKGMTVDWNRGSVSFHGSRWERLTVKKTFWRDLSWWQYHLTNRSLIPFEEERAAGEGILSGTDASGWGTGQVWWLDGGREEVALKFTHAEKRRPINWRELLGIVRAATVMGHRLRGKTLLIETDNMAAKGAVTKMASKAEDMQELIRRLLRASERWGFKVRVTHTPGEKLDRPDQTSRGDAVEEPRARWSERTFKSVEARWGSFDSFIGAERDHASGKPCKTYGMPRSRLWVHPTMRTVASALRQVGQRLAADRGGRSVQALVVVPDGDTPAAWETMMRHGMVVGRTDAGEGKLELNELGQWRPRLSLRASRLVLFPRAAGQFLLRAMITHREGMSMEARLEGQKVAGAGYVMARDGASLRLPLMVGAYVFARGATEDDLGSLYRVVEPNDKELADDPNVVVAVEAKLNKAKGANRLSKLPVFDTLKKEERFRPDPRELFTVDHLVDELTGGATFWRCSFDAKSANVEITKMYGKRSDVDEGGWEMLSTPVRKMTEAECIDSGYSPFKHGGGPTFFDDPDPRHCEHCDHGYRTPGCDFDPPRCDAWLCSLGSPPCPVGMNHSCWCGDESDARAEVEEGKELHGVMHDLRGLHLKQNVLKSGAEGKIKAPAERLRGGETEGVRGGGTVQRCQYGSLYCAGCRVDFELGEEMESHLGGLVHPVEGCRKVHAQALEAERDLEMSKFIDRAAPGGKMVALFSSVKGQSGVYEMGAEAEALVASAVESRAWARTKLVETEQEGMEFLREESAKAAAAALSETGTEVESEMELFYYIPKSGVYKGKLHEDGIHEVIMARAGDHPLLRDHVLASRSLEGILLGAMNAQEKLAEMGTPINPGFHWRSDVSFHGPARHLSPWSGWLEMGKRVPIIDTERVSRLADEGLAEVACWPVCWKGSSRPTNLEVARERARGQDMSVKLTGNEPGGVKAPLPDHACVLMMGLSEVYGEHVVILGKLRGAQGKWVPFGGKKESVDKGGKHTAMREMVEEFFGIESDGAARGELLLQEAERAGAIHGPFGSVQPHQAYILEVDKMENLGGIDRLLTRFRSNRECTQARMVRVSELAGDLVVMSDVHDETIILRDRLGYKRVEAVRGMVKPYLAPAAASKDRSGAGKTGSLGLASGQAVHANEGEEGLEAGELMLRRELKGSQTRRTHLAEKLAPSRLEKITACISGCCGVEKTVANATMCKAGCGRSLHVESCAQMGKGYAALGNFTCVDCRIYDPANPIVTGGSSGSPSLDAKKVRELTTRTMVLELEQGAETTAAGYSEFVRLEEEYASGMGMTLDGQGGNLAMPRHSRGAFKNFMIWLSQDADRARSLESVFRGAGALLTKLKLNDWTKDGETKALFKDLVKECGIEHEPSDTATARMLEVSLRPGGIIDTKYEKSKRVATRMKVNMVTEGVAGLRIGEVAGGGDSHGLLANETAILVDPEKGAIDPMKVVVEGYLEHSKTGFSRYFDIAGMTENSRISVAKIYEDYWASAGFTVTETMQAGIKVRRPDFLVVRVSLLGVDEGKVEKLILWARESKYESVKKHAESTRSYARQRYAASGVASQAKKYVNVAGGNSRDRDLPKIVQELREMGLVANVMAGPFLLATTGGRYSNYTLMPLAVGSVGGAIKEVLDGAYEVVMSDPDSPDPDIEIRAGKKPKFSTHSLRRLANTTARRYREETKTGTDEIDLYFGWNERVLLKAMQVHYAKLSIRERMATARITAKM